MVEPRARVQLGQKRARPFGQRVRIAVAAAAERVEIKLAATGGRCCDHRFDLVRVEAVAIATGVGGRAQVGLLAPEPHSPGEVVGVQPGECLGRSLLDRPLRVRSEIAAGARSDVEELVCDRRCDLVDLVGAGGSALGAGDQRVEAGVKVDLTRLRE